MQETQYKPISQNTNSTLVLEFVPSVKNSNKYQSEQELEDEFIKILQNNGYEYLPIKNNEDLIKNLRKQLEKLNKINFSDDEFDRLMSQYIAKQGEGLVEKTEKIQQDYQYPLLLDNGEKPNIIIIDKKNIHNNSVQVINQYETEGNYKNRYDVSILVNGLPLVHIELKRRGNKIKEAFNQINRYKRDSFWADNGLFEYIQLFIISNGIHTKYYSNTTRKNAINEQSNLQKKNSKKTSNSFEFTSWWTDFQNRKIQDLVDFAKTFCSKHTLLNVLTKYCVFDSDKKLLVMRPYQIAATEAIINKIIISSNLKKTSCTDAGGYIWHTTGSGKTLTSFKSAILATELDFIDKVLFVVDRKDLDYQTMKEYDKFQEGAANANSSTKELEKNLHNPSSKILITTIQKLDRFISKNKTSEIYKKHIVMIFDECHRSQFGDMHKKIIKAFKNYHIFGFTGTPVFPENASNKLDTTERTFGNKLHTYTIINAIDDGNVLPFRTDTISTMKIKENIEDTQVRAIDTKEAYNAPYRIKKVTEYILTHFDQKTRRKDSYSHNKLTNIEQIIKNDSRSKEKRTDEIKINTNLNGFNSIFAVSSIDAAKMYYEEFKTQMAILPPDKKLKIATIYSYGVNEDESDEFIEDENSEDTSQLSASGREFLEVAIKDYNLMFKTNWDTSPEKFQNYYKDISWRMKNREIDLLIVCNMFLTGFDATTLNTLWVDKNLKYHGLLQAFSRTNRILNSIKTYGNIVCFRDLEKATNDALALFGNKDAKSIVLLKTFDEYYNGYENENGEHVDGYSDLIRRLESEFVLGEEIIGEEAKKEFIKLWGAILRVKNILVSFDEFEGNEILNGQKLQDYEGKYNDLYDEFKKLRNTDKESIQNDIEFELELIKQFDINVDYILILISEYAAKKEGQEKHMMLQNLLSTIRSSYELRSKEELLEKFITSLNFASDIPRDWSSFTKKEYEQELEELINKEGLRPEATKKFLIESLSNGEVKETGTEITEILPKVSIFKGRNKIKKEIAEKLRRLLEKYSGAINEALITQE
ncbi:type I restriction endonuclease subunit R [Helicobacter cappadocius]|uniref:Type I restriction enzyme endonuclease subunit n=1 Tax=Helicobacter cappadocius TaxID=3063998 RepID=A0AA90PTE7_9HELI|nr:MULTISPECIES: type I restriction endonuclease subunit R [unclassified Helicobacter]MDO7253366.1 type I restriction endonuclease subunit R [Helicobacter sp. faydin-H75]MDP2539204.1 type I restriction endonuclease subunit R [Helicobacter sp. faydin-H76]